MFEALSQEDKAFDGVLDWMQASFTTQSDGTYVGRVRTRRKPTEVEFPTGLFRHIALLAHLRESFPGQYLPGWADEDGLDDEASRLLGGGLRGGEELCYVAADPRGTLPIPEAGVQAVAAEIRAEAASKRAANAWAEAAAAGDGASAGATASRLAGRSATGVTFGAAASAARGGGGPPQRGLSLPGIPRGHKSGSRVPGPGDRGNGPGGGGGRPGGGGGPAPRGGGGGPTGGRPRAPPAGGGLDIPAIIAATSTAVAAAVAQGCAASPPPSEEECVG